MFNAVYVCTYGPFTLSIDLNIDLLFGQQVKMKEDMSLSSLGTVAFHAAKVSTDVFLAHLFAF